MYTCWLQSYTFYQPQEWSGALHSASGNSTCRHYFSPKELVSSQWIQWTFTWRTLPSIKQAQTESPKLSWMALPATSTVCQCPFLVFVHLVSWTYTSESTLRIRSSFECLFMTCIPGFVVNVTKRAGLPRYVGFSRTSKELESSQWKQWRFTWRTLPSIKQHKQNLPNSPECKQRMSAKDPAISVYVSIFFLY